MRSQLWLIWDSLGELQVAPAWDRLWRLAEGEGDCARPPVVPVLAVPRKPQPGFSVSAFVPTLLSR